MSETLRLDRKIGLQNTFYTKCINVIIDSIGPSIILRSILVKITLQLPYMGVVHFCLFICIFTILS